MKLLLYHYALIWHIYSIHSLLQIPLDFDRRNVVVHLQIGKEPFSFNGELILDLSYPQTIIFLSIDTFEESKSIKVINPMTTLSFKKDTNINAIKVSDTIIFKSIDLILDNAIFYIIYEKANNIAVTKRFGLGFKIEDNSFISQFKSRGLISSLSFSFVNATKDDPSLYFGGIPEDIIQHKYSSKCKVISQLNAWCCSLNQIIVGETVFSIDKPIYLISLHQRIYTPQKFFNEFFQVYFKSAFDESECKLDLVFMLTIDCNADYVVNLPNITFIIDHYIYSFSPAQLFNCNSRYCSFLIAPHEATEWLIGMSFLRHFDILFDHERETITFYSDNVIPRVNTHNEQTIIIKIIIIMCLVILIIGIGLTTKHYLISLSL